MLLGIGLASTIKAISQPDLGFDVSQREGGDTRERDKGYMYYIFTYTLCNVIVVEITAKK